MARKPRNTENRPVRLRDIAERCGVHVMTVSFALRGDSSHVSDDVRRRIRAVAAEMGYDPARTIAARRLVSDGNTPVINHTIALFARIAAAGISDPYLLQWFDGINQVLIEARYALVITYVPIEDTPRSLELFVKTAPPILTRNEVDGLLFPNVNRDFINDVVHWLRGEPGFGNRPIVTMLSVVPGCAAVIIDDCQGAFDAVTHLLSLGHQHIAYFSWNYSVPQNERRRGILQACHSAKMDPATVLYDIPIAERYWADTSYLLRALHGTLRAHPEITAILAPNDTLAISILDALSREGCRIPDDYSLVGFDNVRSWPSDGDNRLTTVAVPVHEMGGEAARLLLDIIEQRADPTTARTLPTQLVIRGTTAPPRHA
ncbi:MAG: LacI family DNA-binding transcriptional regulator [Armatimonadota bacterium]